MRDVRPDPERAQPGCFQSQILLPCGRSSVCPSSQDRAEGQSTGGLRAQLPLGLGNITAFQCQSHFKLISLCIMFFKSFLNKTKIQSVSFHLNVGTKIRFLEWPKKLLGQGEQGALGCVGAAPYTSSVSPAIRCPLSPKGWSKRPNVTVSQKYSLMMPHWDPGWWCNIP